MIRIFTLLYIFIVLIFAYIVYTVLKSTGERPLIGFVIFTSLFWPLSVIIIWKQIMNELKNKEKEDEISNKR